MKENENNSSNENLGVWNDPELEARLVAMLMGELSPFEESEMELELAKSPELRLFRERMIEVKGLIAEVSVEDQDQQGEEDWSLSSERRSRLLENFNSAKLEHAEPEVVSTSPIQWRNVFSIAACLLISLAAFMMMFLRLGKKFKNDDAVITYSAKSSESIIEASTISDGMDDVLKVSPATKGRRYAERASTKFDDREGEKGRDDSEKLHNYACEYEYESLSDEMIFKPEMTNELAKKPSAPSSSMAKVIAANTPSPTAVPVPDLKVDLKGRSAFGDSDEFGDGWGGESGGGFGFGNSDEYFERKAGNNIVKGGLRSGDYAISRNNIDSFLNNPNTPSEPALFTGKKSLNQENESQLLEDESTISNGLIQAEVARRGVSVEESDKAILAGREAYVNKDYEEAVNQYRKSVMLLPQGPIAEERRKEYMGHLLDGSIALSQTYRRTGRYDEARELISNVLEKDPGNVVARKHLEYLDDPIRTSPSLTHKHVENVRKLLNRGKSYYDQAQFDHASLEYKEILRLDPYNKAARRGMEKVNEAKGDYYRAAYDQTRAAMLMRMDQAWEVEVPPVEEVKDEGKLRTKRELDENRLSSIQEYKKKRRIQEDKVEDHRTRLYALSKKLQIPYHGKDGKFYAGRDSDTNEQDRADQAYEEAKRTKAQLESFTRSLNGLSREELRATFLASGRPEATVLKVDYDQLDAMKQRKSVALASGVGANHRTLKSLDASIKEIEGRLDRSVVNVQKKLKEDLVVFNSNVEKLRIDTDRETSDLMVSAEEKTRFGKVREDYERELAILDGIKQAEFSETLSEGLEREVIREKIDPDFSKEISASTTRHSTFSLNVSDVSYKLAKSVLLEKGGMPDAAKIRVEEFVNAFDYGDPSACGKKVNCVVEQCAHPFYQQRNLMRIGMKTGAMGRSQPLRLTVLLDNSGSMERADRVATVVKAMETLASQLGPQDEVTLLSFARDARMVAQKMKGDKAHQLVNLVKGLPSEGGTNLSLAIAQAYATAQQSVQDGTMSRIVLITDGAANLGNADPEDLSKSIEKMRQNGIAFDACGVGAEGLDDDMLEALTRKGDGRYYFIDKPEDADAGFAQKLAGALRPAAKNVKVQVVFNPERVGNYRLVGFEKHRLKKQDFRNDAVDAAEMAAEEAGNALYQVEARPDGRGDVGTVFVRFRDMASGQMVERSWVIPYEPSVSNLSSANPSMQLATVAGMLGERLKLGDEVGIDLEELNQVYGQLRNHFHTDQEVKDLLRMCQKVRR